MKTKQQHITVTSVAIWHLITLLYLSMISCSDKNEEIGFEVSQESPDKRLSAHAKYFRDYKDESEYTARYEFEIVDMKSGLKIASRKIVPDKSRPHVIFRGGVGEIFWSDDSQQVSFGTKDNIIWVWHAPIQK